MAQTITLAGLRNQLITSVFGRKLGFTYGNSSDSQAGGDPSFIVGPMGIRGPTVTVTTASTAADQIPAYGTVILNTTGASTAATTYHSVQNPIPGQSVTIINGTTIAATVYVNGSTGTTSVLMYAQPSLAGSSGLTTAQAINLPKLGTYVCLTAMSTALWFAESAWGTTNTTWGTSAT